MTVTDPTHPLFGRQFPVCALTTEPEAPGTSVLVYYREGIVLRLPSTAVVVRNADLDMPSILSTEAIVELVTTARRFGIHEHRPSPPVGIALRESESPDRSGPDDAGPGGDQ